MCVCIYNCKKSINNKKNNNIDNNNNDDHKNGRWPVLRGVVLRFKEHFFLITTLSSHVLYMILIWQ